MNGAVMEGGERESGGLRRRTPINGRRLPNGSQEFSSSLDAGHRNHSVSESHSPSGPPLMVLNLDDEELRNTPIWSMDAQHRLIAVGCANGGVELYSNSGNLIGFYGSPRIDEGLSGVNQICLKGSRLVLARLNGFIEFLELKLAKREGEREPGIQCQVLKQLRAHQRPINCLTTASTNTLISGSSDHTLKLLDLRMCAVTHTLYGHNGSVLCVCVDENMQVMKRERCASGLT